MGANTVFFSVLYGVVLAEPPYPDAARLVTIRHFRSDTSVPDGRMSRAEVRDVRERARALTGIAAADRTLAPLYHAVRVDPAIILKAE
jgi:hypothetical protein